MAVPVPLEPKEGEVWEFVVKAYDFTVQTALVNRVRYTPTKINPATPMLVPAAQALCAALRARWRATFRTLLHTSYVARIYSVQRIASVSLAPSGAHINIHYDQRRDEYGDTAADTGARAGTQEPNFVTASVYWNTPLINANTRGMMRLSPLVDSDVDGANLTGPFQTLLQTAVDTFSPTYSDVGNNVLWTPGIFSASSAIHTVPLPAAIEMTNHFSEMTGGTAEQQVGSQLSRKNRRNT